MRLSCLDRVFSLSSLGGPESSVGLGSLVDDNNDEDDMGPET